MSLSSHLTITCCFVLFLTLPLQTTASTHMTSSLQNRLSAMCSSQVCHSASSVTQCASFIQKTLQCSNKLCNSASIFQDCVSSKCSPSVTENNFWSCVQKEQNAGLKQHLNKKSYESEDQDEQEDEYYSQIENADSQSAKKKGKARKAPPRKASTATISFAGSMMLLLALSL